MPTPLASWDNLSKDERKSLIQSAKFAVSGLLDGSNAQYPEDATDAASNEELVERVARSMFRASRDVLQATTAKG